MEEENREKTEAVAEGLLLPVQEIMVNEGTAAEDVQEVPEEEQVRERIGLDYLERIETKLNSVLKILNVEVTDSGETSD